MDDEKHLLGKLEGSFNEFLRHHAEDRENRDAWRQEIAWKIEKIDQRLQPIESDHRVVMRVVKWGGGLAATLAGLAKAWEALKDRLG